MRGAGRIAFDRQPWLSGMLEATMPGKERPPDSEELASFAEALGQTFIQRRDLYAKQLNIGSYVSIKKPLRPSHLAAHLRGKMTLGAYLLDRESRGRYLVFDADTEPNWRRLMALSSALAEMGDTSYLEDSRRGGHLWLFFAKPMPARDIRRFGQRLLDFFNIKAVEMFPKQNRLSSGPGSLIRLPFGVHRKSSRRYSFYKTNGELLAPTISEQIHVLRAPEALSKPVLERFWDYVPDSEGEGLAEPFAKPADVSELDASVVERIKDTITVRQFVLRYVELSAQGKGLCPFHDDQVVSFSVNDGGNYWHCFACEEGGSVIDFWMRWRKCDFSTAVTELTDMLLRPGHHR